METQTVPKKKKKLEELDEDKEKKRKSKITKITVNVQAASEKNSLLFEKHFVL